jgi:hypothetical protein
MDGIHDCVGRHHKPSTGFGSPCLQLRAWQQCAKNDTKVATNQLIRKKEHTMLKGCGKFLTFRFKM